MELEKSPACGQSIYRSADAESQLSALAEATLTEINEYPVNSNGETYGSVLLADMVGEAPDLLAAVNQAGVSGYIRSADFPQAEQGVTSASPVIPLYDVNGVVIGSFMMGV